MGGNQSILNSPDQSACSKLFHRHGFQILRVHPNSPVSEARVFPYFDYIIAINSVEVSPDIPNIISEMARNHVNKPLKLTIYNSRQDEERQVTIVPRTGWGGEGLLGCAIRFSPLEGVRDRVWHILNVYPNSPAHKAGLIAEEDYLIASPDILIHNEDEFYQLITQNTQRSVKLVVFNGKSQELREVVIVPDFGWGGEGCLGCDVGSGMVHWIPKIKSSAPVSMASPLKSPLLTSTPASIPPQSITPTPPILSEPILPSLPIVEKFDVNPSFPSISVPPPPSRPLINNLSLQQQESVLTSSSPTRPPSHPPIIPPNAMSSSLPHPSPKSPSFVEDDIPLPNFTVPSDIVNQQ